MGKEKKRCFMKECGNDESSGKVFLRVPNPRQPDRRMKWLQVAGHPVTKNNLYCCEDHFDLKEDAVNWMFYKEVGCALQLKPDVLPRHCTITPRKRRPEKSQVSSSSKKRKREFALKLRRSPTDATSQPVPPESGQEAHPQPSCSWTIEPSSVCEWPPTSSNEITEQGEVVATPEKSVDLYSCSSAFPTTTVVGLQVASKLSSSKKRKRRRKQILVPKMLDDDGWLFGQDNEAVGEGQQSTVPERPSVDQAVTVRGEGQSACLQTYGSPQKHVTGTPQAAVTIHQVQRRLDSVSAQRESFMEEHPVRSRDGSSPLAEALVEPALAVSSPSTSHLQTEAKRQRRFTSRTARPTSRVRSSDDSCDRGSSASLTTTSSYDFSSPTRCMEESESARKLSFKREMIVLAREPRFYFGLPPHHFRLISQLAKFALVPEKNVMLVLKKIRTNDPHFRLANDFGLSVSQASRIFNGTLPKVTAALKHFIYWPSKTSIVQLMPIQFRRNFLDVESIIDGFEIEIEKPSKPSLQSLTWSEYKHCNTIKYLISSTPLGLINFVSPGFGGRISDSKLVERSGYLTSLPNNCTVLADRGFKQIEGLLTQKNVKLVRPPSVSKNQQLSKKDARDNKRIASNRVHIERVISRVREFKFLAPHACVDNHLVHLLDDAVIVACAIINLQDPIISNI